MTHFRTRAAVSALVLLMTTAAALAAGRQALATPRAQAQTAAPGALVTAQPVVVAEDQSATQTQAELDRLLDRYPPALGRVLKLDPSLIGNQAYLAAYPALSAFFAQHPDIARNSRFYFANVSTGESMTYVPDDPRVDMWRRMIQGLTVFLVFIIVTGTLAWLIKMLVEHRTWVRAYKAQTEMQNKLLDRLTPNEDLLAYLQTPAGKRLLESAPIAFDASAPGMGGSVRRVLWAVQAGLVLAAGGGGVLFVSGHVDPEVAQPLFAIGVLALSLGIGFVLSAIVSFVLSKRLGLLERPSLPGQGDRGAATGA
jgi:hypothetical protein